MPGFFVTVEGIDGAGKTGVAARLCKALVQRGHEVVSTREPGGTPVGEALRAALLSDGAPPMTPRAALLLFLADRAEHAERVILPALARGAVVVSDRYSDSTRAYQGAGHGVLPDATIQALDNVARGAAIPDLTLLIDVPIFIGMRRVREAGRAPDRWERETADFHARVRRAFLEIAQAEPGRVVVLDGLEDSDLLGERAVAVVEQRWAR